MIRILFILFLFSSLFCEAQPPANFFTTLGGSGDDIAYSVKVTVDANYIVVGSTSSFGNGGTDVYLMKLDTMGNTLWTKTIGAALNEVGKSIIELSDSGFVITGYTSSLGSGGYDAYVVRTDKFGNPLWQRSFGGNDWDFGNDLTLGADGNIYVVGYTYSFGAGKKDGFVLKYDVNGNLLQQKLVGGAENEELNSIIKAADNSLVTVGYTESVGDIDGDALVIKYDTNLDTVYTRRFGGPDRDFASDIMQKTMGDFILCGARTYSTGGNTHSYFLRFSNTGAFVLDGHEFRNDGDEFFVSTANSAQSELFTAFVRTCSFSNIPGIKKQIDLFISTPGGYAYLVNSTGEGGDEFVYSVESTKDGGYIIAGSTESYSSIGKDCFIVKVDSAIVNKISLVNVEEKQKSEDIIKLYYANEGLTLLFSESSPRIIEIYSGDGTKVYQENSKETLNLIGCSNFAPGIYIVFITDKKGRRVAKRFVRD